MGDSYAEVIVHDEKDSGGLLFRAGLIALTAVLLIYGVMFQALFLMLGILMAGVSVWLIKNRYREYEYLLVSEELDITVIKNRTRRKKLDTFRLAELQCMAPVKSHRLDGFHGNPKLTVRDYSSGNPEHDIYSMIFSRKGELLEVKVEPNEAMLKEIQMHHASILYRD